jgi:hypothetical protein
MIQEVSEQLFQLAAFNPFDFSSRERLVDIRAWIASPYYYVDSLTTSNQFTLNIKNWEALKIGVTNDVNRFATAAVESTIGVTQYSPLPKHSAWLAIRAYYAAFYSAHAIIRLFGHSCTQLDFEHAKAVWSNADALGIAGAVSRVDSGFYAIEVNSNMQTMAFTKLNDSHSDTWAALTRLLTDLRKRVASTKGLSKRKLDSELFLDALIAVLKHSGSNKGNWLSCARNLINYRFAYGTWFPFDRSTNYGSELMERDAQLWHTNDSLVTRLSFRDDIQRMIHCCVDLVRFCQFLIAAFADKVAIVPMQLTHGVFRLRNLLQVA